MTTDSSMPCSRPETAELLALYALSALSESECAEVESHLVACPSCQARLADEQATLAEVARLAPASAMPIGMRERTLTHALAVRAPIPPEGWVQPDDALPASIRVPRQPQRSAPPQRLTLARRLSPRWQRRLLALAAVLVLVLLPWNVALQLQLAHQQVATQQSQQTQQALAAILASPQLGVYRLAGTRDASAIGHLYVDPVNGHVAIVASNLPQLDASRTYQAWLNHAGTRTSVGIFRPSKGSSAVLVGTLPQRLSYYSFLGITVEPSGGSPHPTGPNVMLGAL